MNEACHTYEWVMSHSWMSHVNVRGMSSVCAPGDASCHTWMSHVTRMNQSRDTYKYSCDTYEWVMAHIWMSHVTHMNPARKASWNPAGVNPVHWKTAEINPDSLQMGTNEKCTLVRSKWYKSHTKVYTGSKTRSQEASWGRKPAHKKLLGRRHLTHILMRHVTVKKESCHSSRHVISMYRTRNELVEERDIHEWVTTGGGDRT